MDQCGDNCYQDQKYASIQAGRKLKQAEMQALNYTIAGKIVPFEEVGNISVGKVVFAKGSIEIGDPGKVKMLMQHKADKPIGRMQKFNKAEDGIYASFKISASMQVNPHTMTSPKLSLQQCLCDFRSWFSP